jgi:plastocyanin
MMSALLRTALAIATFSLVVSFAQAETHVIVQTNQQFLNADAESKVDEIKKSTASSTPFLVKKMTIKKGDAIQFKNLDKMVHNVYGEGFDLKAQPPGDQRSQKFDQPGHYSVKCAIHPKMKFDVEVEK